jgi:hypothetical protein
MMPTPFPSIWNLPANPVFRRHAVTRLRPLPLLVWVFVTQTLAGFGWALGFLVSLRLASGNRASLNFMSPDFRDTLADHGLEAALIAWIVVLVLQGMLLFFKGTFSVATGVAREAFEGMTDAQRLTPLPTGHKVLGQLAGLPVQETTVAGLLTIWVVPSILLGGLPVLLVVQVYLILATSAVLHHAIGLVAGTIIQQKILAGTLSQLLVVLLHFGLPMAGYFGIGAISHLAADSALTELFQVHLGDRNPFEVVDTSIAWFGHPVPAAVYTWALIMLSIGILVAILYRRWNDSGSQLLGKPGTVVAAAVLLVVTWGEFHGFTPAASRLARFLAIRVNETDMVSDHLAATLLWVPGFATVLGLLNLVAATMLAPSPIQRGLHRHAVRPRPWHDGAPAIPWLVAICLMTSATFHGIVTPMLAGAGIPPMHPATPWLTTAAFIIPACAWLLAIVRLGWRGAGLVAFLAGILPLLLAALVAVTTGDPITLARWIIAISAPVLPMFAWLSGLDDQNGPLSVLLLVPSQVSLALHAGFIAWLAWRKPSAKVLSPTLQSSADPAC